ncbi:MAG TPA: tetratricopeptide repeat protein [Usitatibacter sp.]|nr:tetratricopeptide repeat protein [Usitatibacter sp.]
MERAARLYEAGNLEAARSLCEDILRADSHHFYALHLLATIAATQGEHEDCVRLASRAIQANPRNAEALSNRGAALRALCRFDEALADYDRALALEPRSAAILNNRGVTLAALGRHREAVECYDRALEAEPKYARARHNRGLSRLMLGVFPDAWEDYEWRWPGGETPSGLRPFPFPTFQAADFGKGRRIALWCEQGLGDNLAFSTLTEELARRGEAFVLEADRRLVASISRAHPGWNVVSREDSPKEFLPCDRHLPLGSLGALFRRSLQDFAAQPRAFLAPDGARAESYRARIADGARGPIGVSWRTFQARGRGFYERTRSAPLAAFGDLSRMPGIRLVDLQYGDTKAEREAFAHDSGELTRIEELDLYNDLDGLVALISACDAVVTTDNATAHLAGAAGKRTLLLYLSANAPSHYWAPTPEGRSRWYPSVEIVTARDVDTWQRALSRVQQVLAAR